MLCDMKKTTKLFKFPNVSILVLMEYALRHESDSVAAAEMPSVSILVLMEYALRPGCTRSYLTMRSVSILVLMEYALRLSPTAPLPLWCPSVSILVLMEYALRQLCCAIVRLEASGAQSLF